MGLTSFDRQRMSAPGGGFNRSMQHLLILSDWEMSDGGECADMDRRLDTPPWTTEEFDDVPNPAATALALSLGARRGNFEWRKGAWLGAYDYGDAHNNHAIGHYIVVVKIPLGLLAVDQRSKE